MILDRIALSILIIGGLDWASVGIFRYNFLAHLFRGEFTTASRVAYVLIGLSALWCISLLFRKKADETEVHRVHEIYTEA
jgi:uncharacterized membrane protein YuzA (DUF378 family)